MTTQEHLSGLSFADLYCLKSHLSANGPNFASKERREKYALLLERAKDEMIARVEVLAVNLDPEST